MKQPPGPDGPRSTRRLGEETPEQPGLRITFTGEAGLCEAEELRARLGPDRLDGVREIQLVLSRLTFCDVRCFNELLACAHEARQYGVTVTVLDANPWFLLMAALLDVGGDLGLKEPVRTTTRDERLVRLVRAPDLDVDGEFELVER